MPGHHLLTPHSNREPLSQRLRVPSRHCSAVPTTSVRLHPNSIPNGNRQPDPDTKSCEAESRQTTRPATRLPAQRPDPLGTKARPKRATNTKHNITIVLPVALSPQSAWSAPPSTAYTGRLPQICASRAWQRSTMSSPASRSQSSSSMAKGFIHRNTESRGARPRANSPWQSIVDLQSKSSSH